MRQAEGDYMGDERRSMRASESRDQLATWLGIAPASLTQVPARALESLVALLETAIEQYPGRLAALRAQVERQEEISVELDQLASRDHLSGIANRRGLEGRLEDELRRAQRYARPISVISIDLDGLKQVNDELGHSAGDSLIKATADRLEALVRASDCVGRVGGDEFLVVCPETDAAAAAGVAAKISARVAAEPVRGNQRDLTLSLSIGWATAEAGDTPASLVKRADEALYLAKRGGRGRTSGPAG